MEQDTEDDIPALCDDEVKHDLTLDLVEERHSLSQRKKLKTHLAVYAKVARRMFALLLFLSCLLFRSSSGKCPLVKATGLLTRKRGRQGQKG
jgi:hypothetical protein